MVENIQSDDNPALPGVIRIVIVEDQCLVREALVTALSADPSITVVGEAADGPGGLALIQEENPDVAVVDLALRGSSGLDILKAVKHQKLSTKVVVLTGSQQSRDVSEAVRLDVNGYVIKSSAFHELLTAVKQAAEGGCFMSSSAATQAIRQQGRALSDLGRLSAREREVLAWIAEGLTDKEIADQLGVALTTVRTHRARVRRKLDLHGTGELVRYALENDIRV